MHIKSKVLSVVFVAALSNGAALAQTYVTDFDTLTSPDQGVGGSYQVYQEDGPGGFTVIRIADPNDDATLGNHFHTIRGNGSSGHPNMTAANFFSDDGSPILYFLGDYTGTNKNDWAPDFSTARAFSLTSFTILDLEGEYTLTASNGSSLVIDHTGTYDGALLSGFQNIMSFQHDYTGSVDGSMVIDDISVNAVPEPATMVALGAGLVALVRRRRVK